MCKNDSVVLSLGLGHVKKLRGIENKPSGFRAGTAQIRGTVKGIRELRRRTATRTRTGLLPTRLDLNFSTSACGTQVGFPSAAAARRASGRIKQPCLLCNPVTAACNTLALHVCPCRKERTLRKAQKIRGSGEHVHGRHLRCAVRARQCSRLPDTRVVGLVTAAQSAAVAPPERCFSGDRRHGLSLSLGKPLVGVNGTQLACGNGPCGGRAGGPRKPGPSVWQTPCGSGKGEDCLGARRC